MKRNEELAALSSYAAMTGGRYKKPLTDDAGDTGNGTNVMGLLTECGFNDVQANKYYFLPTEPDSVSCVAGHKTLKVGDEKYEFIAVTVYSPGYGQEFAGNLTVGKDGLHQGFKAARDEIVRFLKNYMEEHEIEGALKFWITGHSRSEALSVAGSRAGDDPRYAADSAGEEYTYDGEDKGDKVLP